MMNRIAVRPVAPAVYSGINMLSKDLLGKQEYGSYEWQCIDANGNITEK